MKRKVMTVKQIARWVGAEIVPDEEGSTSLCMDREWTLDTSRGLHQRTADELATLHDRLSRAIPDDFDFSLEFDDGEVFGTLEYADGPHAGYGSGFPVTMDRNFIKGLREYNWDELRVEVIAGTQLHENLADAAEDLPSTLEDITEIQKIHSKGIAAFCKQMEVVRPHFALLTVSEDEDESPEYEVTGFDGLEKLLGELGDLLTLGHTLVAIWREGASLPPAAVEELRQDALEGLGPISRAKAEGRFQDALQAMMGGNF